MKKTIYNSHILALAGMCLLTAFLFSHQTVAQTFIPLWDKNHTPNSKGIEVKDSIANERIYQVGTPGMTIWQPSTTENKHAAVVIIPGGGYARLAYVISGTQIAKWFNTFGVTAFVLQHRLPHSPDLIDPTTAPLQDAQRALKIIRANARQWDLDTSLIGSMGCSAGGHLAACTGTHLEDLSIIGDSIDKQNHRPSFMILISPVVSMSDIGHKGSRNNLLGNNPTQQLKDAWSNELLVTPSTPPTILFHAADDKTVSPTNSILFYQALLKNEVSGSALHIFPQGGHSIALRNNPGTCNLWTSIAEQWLMEIIKK